MIETLDMRSWLRVEAISYEASVDRYDGKALGIEDGVNVALEADGVVRVLHLVHCSRICVIRHGILVKPLFFHRRDQVSVFHRIITLRKPAVRVGRRLRLLRENRDLCPVGGKRGGKLPVLEAGNDRVVYDCA